MANSSNIGRRRAQARNDSSPLYDERRKALLEAAGAVFREKGYHAATLRDVANATGGDRASLYYYVESKQELFEAVVEDAVTANVEGAERVRDSDADPRAKLREIVELLMRSFDEHYPHLFVFVQEDALRLDDGDEGWTHRMVEWQQRYFRAVRDIIDEGLETGVLTSDLPSAVIAQAVIGLVSWSHRWFRPGGEIPASEVGRGFADIVLSGLAVAPTRGRAAGKGNSRAAPGRSRDRK